MARKQIKTVESMREYCRKAEMGEIDNPEEWYVRHPDNPALLKKVKDLEEVGADGKCTYSKEEIEEFKKHFLSGDNVRKDREVQSFEVTDDAKAKKK